MKISLIPLLLLPFTCLLAGPGTFSEHIHVDQLGYRPSAQKIALLSDPQTGFNGSQSFSPGTTYHLRRWSDDVSVFSAAISAWNGGATHSQSGDKVWWFDFSSVTVPGEYYVWDPINSVGSYGFSIGEQVYEEALKRAMRAFYYQRCGVAKNAAQAGNWSDAACHNHSLQDLNCRSVSDPTNAATEKDLSGGWHDAGDYNKYVNFSYATVHSLLFAYMENPAAFSDNYGIPESGNGIPDILDELKVELDWLLKMQQSDGSVLMKVAVPCWEGTSPPSADLAQRLYGPAQASATRSLCSMFAHAYLAYSSLGNAGMTTYANTLRTKAELAWTWISNNPGTSSYPNTGFCSANPEVSATEQNETRTGAAAMLFAATGNATYKTYFESNYTAIRPYSWTYWYPFQPTIQDIMLYYAHLPGVTAGVATNIKNSCTTSMNSNNADMLPAWLANTDAYRAYLKNSDYVWGSNLVKANAGSIFYNMVEYNLSPANQAHYLNAAENFIHFLHGANPINQLMLTNMGAYGAEKSCNEMYHGWFGDGTPYDNAQTSTFGPAPGYVTGGFNPTFVPDPACGCTIAPPQNQPQQKAYKDWNTSWPQNSWEITEPAIYTQAGYVKLLSKFLAATTPAVSVSVSGSHVTCFGSSDGSATATPSGGTGGYTYLWSNAATTQSINDLTAGTYSVTVSAGGGGTATGSFTVNQPTAVTVSVSGVNPTSGNNGSATAVPSGGTPPYIYSWSNGGNTASITGLAAGTYAVTTADGNDCTAFGSVTLTAPPTLKFEHGTLLSVTTNWQTVTLANTYTSMVVVATPVMSAASGVAIVTRVQNASGNSFQIKIQAASNAAPAAAKVHYMVAEEGIYTVAANGVKFEAKKVNSSLTARDDAWVFEPRSYGQPYTSPVVVGQVMTANDTKWSVFWASQNGNRSNPPSASSFAAGKHVAEDPIAARAAETLGYFVFESGTGTIAGKKYRAALGSDIVRGTSNNTSGYSYALTGLTTAEAAVLSSAAMDDANGAWAVLATANPLTATTLKSWACEDDLLDAERNHSTEQHAYLVIGTGPGPNFDAPGDAGQKSGASQRLLKVYPNPATTALTLEFEQAMAGEATLLVLDVLGRVLLTKELEEAPAGLRREALGLEGLGAGCYFLSVMDGEGKRQVGFVVWE